MQQVEDLTPSSIDIKFPMEVIYSIYNRPLIELDSLLYSFESKEYNKSVGLDEEFDPEQWVLSLVEDYQLVIFSPVATRSYVNTKALPYYRFRVDDKIEYYSYFVGVK